MIYEIFLRNYIFEKISYYEYFQINILVRERRMMVEVSENL